MMNRPAMKLTESFDERREHRRHDLESHQIKVDRWDGARRSAKPLGTLVDLSAGGLRVRTSQANVRPDQQIRVRIELPAYAGISPFIDTRDGRPNARHEWVGWMTVARVQKINDEECDVAGRLCDMEDIDRGMLGLYLSTQPLAA